MNKKRKHILIIIVSAIALYVVFYIGRVIVYIHSTTHNPKEYLWLYNDSIKCDLDTMFSIGETRKTDECYNYLYKSGYYIMILEYKQLGSLDIQNVLFHTHANVNLNHFISSFWGEEYNMDLYPIPETYINFKLPFQNGFSVSLDTTSRIEKWIEGKNYRGFFGKIFHMSFNNAEGKPLVFFDYKYIATPTLFLLYKHQGRFIVIIINSKEKFDDKIMHILDLE